MIILEFIIDEKSIYLLKRYKNQWVIFMKSIYLNQYIEKFLNDLGLLD